MAFCSASTRNASEEMRLSVCRLSWPIRHTVLSCTTSYSVQEVVLQVGLQLAPLLAHIGEVDEEARAHVALQQFHLGVGRRAETPHQQVAVLQQAAASDLLGAPGADEALAQVTEGGAEVAVDALAENGGVESGGHGVLRALVEEEQRVQADLEGVHAELKLAPEGVHELELHVLAAVVGEGDETPAVGEMQDRSHGSSAQKIRSRSFHPRPLSSCST
ncbi:hypothetical protein EYF80_042367 [Liparis tanakae]|uniref:Uncharacterized protein n=1 Tax=Liparis tanakae TaxID=230148 RepID=A0A4Z2G3P0_9TELE|nr:hypothetical protein EYF80_042367 [Liparis tanakae]